VNAIEILFFNILIGSSSGVISSGLLELGT